MRLSELDRWRLAPVLAAALGRRALPDPRPAHGRPGRAPLPRRPVRARGLHDLERQLVRRPPHARLQRAVPAARALPDAAGRGRDRRRGRRRAVRAARPRTVRREGEAGARSGSASRSASLCSPGGCRSCSASPSGSARCWPCSAAASRSRRCWPSPARSRARWPGSSSRSPRSPTRRSRAHAAARCSPGLAVAAPVLLSVAFPEGGFQPFTFRSFAPVPIFCALLFVLLPREQKTLRVGAVLYATRRHRGVPDRHADGQQRRPARGAVRRGDRPLLPAVAARAAAAARAHHRGDRRACRLAASTRPSAT